MIRVSEVSKSFGDLVAVNNVTLTARDGEVFGLVGTNGAGKSTLMRMMCGVLSADAGEILLDDRPVYDNEDAKRDLFFVSDDAYFFPHATAADMGDFYGGIYGSFDRAQYDAFLHDFSLDADTPLTRFSKGMRRQVSLLLGLCAGTKYLFCDETFDGLDPVMRQAMKSLLAKYMADRGLTPVVTSHNLRELEDFCDHIGLLHKGGVILSRDLADMKLMMSKLQIVFTSENDRTAFEEHVTVLSHKARGRMHTYTLRSAQEVAEAAARASQPVYYELLPLSLEEIFISETEVVGYDVRKYILGE